MKGDGGDKVRSLAADREGGWSGEGEGEGLVGGAGKTDGAGKVDGVDGAKEVGWVEDALVGRGFWTREARPKVAWGGVVVVLDRGLRPYELVIPMDDMVLLLTVFLFIS